MRAAAGRPHLLRVQLPGSFPASAPSAWMDLPEPFGFSWGPGSSTLVAVARHARQVRINRLLFERIVHPSDATSI
jgi:hypothetical protein